MKCLSLCVLLLCVPLAVPAAASVSVPEGLLLAEAGTGKVPPKAVAKPAPKKKPATRTAKKKVASKTPSRKQADAIANDLPAPKLDLSLPKAMVDTLEPSTKPKASTAAKPLLPEMFERKAGPESFELNGRLLSNEMDLNLRNDARKDVDGAALDFKFSQ